MSYLGLAATDLISLIPFLQVICQGHKYAAGHVLLLDETENTCNLKVKFSKC